MNQPTIHETKNGAVKRVMFDGGYATFDAKGVPGWHYFLCDPAGSVRVVADMWGRAEQINHYYPYGLTFADAGKAPDHQPCKFGGKELDAMYGLNLHDFHARLQIPDLGRFDRPDPLCEIKYNLSPYLFCDNDPINKIDPSGMFAEREDAEKYARMFAYTLDDGTKVTPEVHTDDDGKFYIEMNEDGTGAYRGEGKAVRDYGKNGWPNSAFSDVFPKKMADAICNALGYPNMAVGSLIEDAATVPGSEGKVSGATQVTKSLGKEVGSIYKATEFVGNVTMGTTFARSVMETGYYIANPPVSNKVFAKSFADVIAAAAPAIAGPPGAVFSIAYTLIDYITDGFGINYKVAIPQ